MMKEWFEKGQVMTRDLGLENKSVILFWKAYEEKRLLACGLLYKAYEISKRAD